MENIETTKEQENIDQDNENKVEDAGDFIINETEGILDRRYLCGWLENHKFLHIK
jgi:hypothetical protein